MNIKVGERYKLWDMAVKCLSITPNGNALCVLEDKNREFLAYKEEFHRLQKIKLSGKKVLVIGRFKETISLVSYVYENIETYRNSIKPNSNFVPLAIKEVEWEEGEGL